MFKKHSLRRLKMSLKRWDTPDRCGMRCQLRRRWRDCRIQWLAAGYELHDNCKYWRTGRKPVFGTVLHIGRPIMSLPAPAGCVAATNAADLTRFQVYRYEIDNGELPVSTAAPGLVDGAPACNGANAVSPATPGELGTDRRIVTFAVVDCLGDGPFTGKEVDLPVKLYVNGFMTEPVTADSDIILEIVGTDAPGDGSIAEVVAREWVEVVR